VPAPHRRTDDHIVHRFGLGPREELVEPYDVCSRVGRPAHLIERERNDTVTGTGVVDADRPPPQRFAPRS
jgi:hypothetical protein